MAIAEGPRVPQIELAKRQPLTPEDKTLIKNKVRTKFGIAEGQPDTFAVSSITEDLVNLRETSLSYNHANPSALGRSHIVSLVEDMIIDTAKKAASLPRLQEPDIHLDA